MKGIAVILFLIHTGLSAFAWQNQPPELTGDTLIQQEEKHPQMVSSNDYYGAAHQLPVHQFSPLAINKQLTNSWITWVIMISLGSVAMARFFFPSRLEQFFKAILGNRFFNQMERDGNFFNETLTYLLFFNYLAVLALLIIQTYLLFAEQAIFIFTWHLGFIYLAILGLLGVFYLLKTLFTGIIAWIFKTQTANSTYLKNIYLFNHLTGIILLPIVAYTAFNTSLTGILIAWFIILAGSVLKVGRNIVMVHKQAGFSVYYIILYLCAIELVPVLLLFKAANNFLPIS